MTIGERIAVLIDEKGVKKIDFAAALNIHQSYVSKLISGESSPSERLKEDICRKFGVRREWLEHGEGEMFVRRSAAIIEQLSKEYQLDDKARRLVENFLSLTPENRAMVIKAFENAVMLMTRKPDDELTKEEAMAQVGREWEEKEAARKRGTTTSSVSIGTNGSRRKFGNGS